MATHQPQPQPSRDHAAPPRSPTPCCGCAAPEGLPHRCRTTRRRRFGRRLTKSPHRLQYGWHYRDQVVPTFCPQDVRPAWVEHQTYLAAVGLSLTFTGPALEEFQSGEPCEELVSVAWGRREMGERRRCTIAVSPWRWPTRTRMCASRPGGPADPAVAVSDPGVNVYASAVIGPPIGHRTSDFEEWSLVRGRNATSADRSRCPGPDLLGVAPSVASVAGYQ